ncbi:P-loop containing nucleoside triphosphate hydrolase protein [Mycena belliarum]|uniref:P-loop containing nucleoside triphosphate hydrolase protein n=1 Tax=Mycena belliarum TaxID=1033014 RepID=A0AAD6XXM6_9AGAR|nr:P-loop containing nucleoside triphosphate hydrolase protein [Mycena belliae]
MANPDPAQLSQSQYATHRKELLALMNQLRSVGAQGDLDLPRITVIGNQSAGKSSVVEAISGIKVPRDAGTCTRCPLECRLSSSTKAWSCRISIRFEYDDKGRALKEITERPANKSEVEVILRRAQLAVLNPGVAFETILEMNPDDLKKGIPGKVPLPFSRNIVCVDLEGPELTDLMFLDLPGIIQNAEPDVVQLVEDMVVSHIQGNCLILVALPMTDDIENQKALRLARQQDPEGRRTIGVLTKPDMLSTGSKVRDLWLDVLEGRKHQLHHGYYCTRQPDDDERSNNIAPSAARRTEAAFFAKTAPWSTSTHQDHFGTDNLVSTLSTLLVQIIHDRLPFIRQMANNGLEACRQELASLPEKIVAEPATHMLNLITAFCTDIRGFVEGQSDMSSLIHERNAAFATFKKAINSTQPRFVARIKGQAGTSSFPIHIDNDLSAAATELIATQRSVYLPDIRLHIAKSITRELPGNIPFSAKKSLITAFQHSWLKFVKDCFDAVKHAMLALLMRCIDDKFGRYELLKTRMTVVITAITGKYYEDCGNFLMALLEVEQMPFTMNDHYLQSSTEKWLSRYKDERAGKARSDAEEPANKRRKVAASSTEPTAKAEPCMFKPTVIACLTAMSRSQVRGPYAAAASAKPSGSASATADPDPDKANSAIALLAELGYPGLTVEDFGKLRPGDEYETEITVMSEVRGYFQRVIDNIPSLIDHKFLRGIARTLQQDLISEFGLGSENANAACAIYLTEDPRVVAQREDLMARQRRLETVQVQLHNFGLNKAVMA